MFYTYLGIGVNWISLFPILLFLLDATFISKKSLLIDQKNEQIVSLRTVSKRRASFSSRKREASSHRKKEIACFDPGWTDFVVLWNNRFKEPGFLNHDQFTLQSCSNHLNHRKKKRFTTKVKLIHGQHWQWLAASLSLKSCLDDQNGTLKKSFLEFFAAYELPLDTI